MKKILILSGPVWLTLFVMACSTPSSERSEKAINDSLNRVFQRYYDERMAVFPLEATDNGIDRYNDRLEADFTDSYREKLRDFYSRHLKALAAFNLDSLPPDLRVNALVMRWELETGMESLDFPLNRLPIDQFWGLHLKMGQYASGTAAQPFRSVKDYDDWRKRVEAFSVWTDSAVAYLRKGMTEGIVLPAALVVKIIPQLEAMVTDIPDSNLYFSPVKLLPDSLPDKEKQRITSDYRSMVASTVVPLHRRLADFLKKDYLPSARATSGIGSLPGGKDMYRFLVRQWTTTDLSPDSIYEIGLAEVKKLRTEMEGIRQEVGYKGNLKSFFDYLYEDSKFFPYRSPDEVLNAFRRIDSVIKPKVSGLFSVLPKTPFEIRRTEAFREASGSAEYIASTDGVKPGIFYVPVPDARKFNTSGMESLFLHEAIPGHHFQISLQMENTSLPEFRRHAVSYNTYVEGWALYCETLGKELGLYSDPYQYFTALGEQMLRAVRLVMDVGLHHKGMTREEAIRFMMDNYPTTMEYAVSETERYMAVPGQALGYRIGVIRIKAMRDRFRKELGERFSLTAFHDAFLKMGSMPIGLAEDELARTLR
jgi:uncharacterized protein (DUF885 family)